MHNIAYVEIGADIIGTDLVDEGPQFQRRQQEFIPYILDRDGNACAFRVRNQLTNGFLSPLVGIFVIDDC